MEKIVLIGAGGHAKVIIDILKSNNEYEIVGVTDKIAKGAILGVPVIGDDDSLQGLFASGVKNAFLCVGALANLEARNKIYDRVKEIGFKFPVIIHKHAIVSVYAQIEAGVCIMAGAVVNPGARLGYNCIINTGCIIEHDCIVGDNSHISPGARLAGEVIVGNNTHIGIGSTIIQQLRIGDNVTIGAGATVIDNICDHAVAVGVPAKIIIMKTSGY